ncbi:Tat pathway signal protein [Amylibacter sp. SFDW26]|uniref:Tat pathway signal protein n=1 Tax=Amylibacter sp. SFDW26 TaxID=2652722 RepID=UPI001262068B|nr:Tat pathway signal protein [Amylibacter sp. SFDW26]KAB7616184.1 Tat pathway signal protein [Amylibacter sp. SFDW26]
MSIKPQKPLSNKITRRGLLATASAAGAVKFLPNIAKSPPARRILTVYYDKAIGAMRAIDRVVR